MEDRRQRRLHGLPEVTVKYLERVANIFDDGEVTIISIYFSNFYMVQQQSISRTMISSTRS